MEVTFTLHKVQSREASRIVRMTTPRNKATLTVRQALNLTMAHHCLEGTSRNGAKHQLREADLCQFFFCRASIQDRDKSYQ